MGGAGNIEDGMQLSVSLEQMVNTATRDNPDRELENAEVVFAAEKSWGWRVGGEK